MRTTKEQLENQLEKVRDSHSDWVSGDIRRRKEFAKAFGWSNTNFYPGETTSGEPTWTEIYIEIGKLLAGQYNTRIEGQINDLFFKVDKLITTKKKK